MSYTYGGCFLTMVWAIGEKEPIFNGCKRRFPQWLEGNLVEVRLDNTEAAHYKKEYGLLALKQLTSKFENTPVDVDGQYNVDKNEFNQLVEIVAASPPNMTFGAKIYMNGAIGDFFIPDKVTRLRICYGDSIGDFPQFSPTSRCQVHLEIVEVDTDQVLNLFHSARQNSRNLSLVGVDLEYVPLTHPLMSRLETLELNSLKLDACLQSTSVPPTKGITCKSMKKLETTTFEEFSYFTSPSLRVACFHFIDIWSELGNFSGLQELKNVLERSPSLTRVNIWASVSSQYRIVSDDPSKYWSEFFYCFAHLKDLEDLTIIASHTSFLTFASDQVGEAMRFLAKTLPRLDTLCIVDCDKYSFVFEDGELKLEDL
ncbi:hypothetical protein TRICI_005836 [Trichomonascus ciferrii]|uniref:Uncharacterized protein n=1 Tax=Trichomonascus ciferrii TaxID=44093 RepID=A0A642UP16_9ASCO|nr:hypothetical protein TRICI_005836 [Trichomonascus ciferrii]